MITKRTQWHKHGDHQDVCEYGKSITDQYPIYKMNGFIPIGFEYINVKPTDWIIEKIKDGCVVEVKVCNDGEHLLI